MATRAQLLSARAALAAAARAGEPWEASYKQDMATFRRMLKVEQELQNLLGEYFLGLSLYRLSNLINWDEVNPKLSAAIVVNGDDAATKQEETLLVEVVLPSYEELMIIGATAGVAITGIPVDMPSLTPVLMDNARKSTAQLVKGVTDTTRAILQRTIQSSLAKGDDLGTLTTRLQKTINNPVRAEMIAQTETVNAYQSGYFEFAKETGATTKEWEAKIGACKLCAPLDGQVLPIEDMFVLGNGKGILRPAAHTRCRCGLIYNYD